jgi:Na+-driven multidrug efflux pump
MQVGFLLYLRIASQYGTSAVAAYFIGVRILALSFLPGGFGAPPTIVGQQLGARLPDNARRSGWGSQSAGHAVDVGGGDRHLHLCAAYRRAVRKRSTRGCRRSELHPRAGGGPRDGGRLDLGGALRGAGDTRFPLLTVIVGFYEARLGCAWAAANLLGLDLGWVWAALLGDYVLRAVLKAWRFNSGRWQRVRV